MPGFVIWIVGNLFLASIPVALAFGIARGLEQDLARAHVRWGLWLPLLALWLLFLPNTCYLLTEWRHYLATIHESAAFAPIYERGRCLPGPTLGLLALTTFYICYTGAGLLAFLLAVRPLHHLAQGVWGRAARPLGALLCLLCALGVYLGLINRFNSWDLIHPTLASAILTTSAQALVSPLPLVLILVFSAFLWLLYAAFDIWMEGFAARRQAILREKFPHASA